VGQRPSRPIPDGCKDAEKEFEKKFCKAIQQNPLNLVYICKPSSVIHVEADTTYAKSHPQVLKTARREGERYIGSKLESYPHELFQSADIRSVSGDSVCADKKDARSLARKRGADAFYIADLSLTVIVEDGGFMAGPSFKMAGSMSLVLGAVEPSTTIFTWVEAIGERVR